MDGGGIPPPDRSRSGTSSGTTPPTDRRQLKITAEEDDVGPSLCAEIGLDDDDHVER